MKKLFLIRFFGSQSDNLKSKIQNPKWLGLSLITFVLVVSGAAVQAQQPAKIPRIGFLLAPSRSALSERVDAFRQGLRELGYVEGQNIVIEYRYAEGKFDRLPDLAADLARLKVDVIVAAGGMQAIRAAKNTTNTTPIVMTGALDPVGDALIASFARPGGSITGLSLGGQELYGKRLELLKETVPKVSRVAVFWYRTTPAFPSYLKEMHASAQSLGLQIQTLEVRTPSDFEAVFDAAAKGGARAFTLTTHPIFTGNRNPILDFAAKSRRPAIYPWTEYVEDGGLMSYGPKLSDLYRRAATYVDKILKGAKPADLPVEQPTKFEFIINLKTAKALNLTIPESVLFRADKVIK
jgi:putative tryptophan/tyrosine transport system substrate-binding protein